jgi:RNA polymerase sigma-70 factor, ECF subfamily
MDGAKGVCRVREAAATETSSATETSLAPPARQHSAVSNGQSPFEDIVREHQGMVFSIALHFLRDRALAEELAQDVFLSLYNNLGSIKSAEHMVYWLRKVTSNRCVDETRRYKFRRTVSLQDVVEPGELVKEKDLFLSEKLGKLVASLPEKARMVMILRYQEDMELGDISSLLGMPLNTVKSHIKRSLAMLREKLNTAFGKDL